MRSLLRSCLLAVGLAVLLAPAASAGTITRGDVSATLTWDQGEFQAENGHLTISRNGELLVDTDLAPQCRDCDYLGADPGHALHVRDLDGDGDQEVLVDFYSGGAHCCSSTLVWYLKDHRRYERRALSTGNSGYRLRNPDGDDRWELVSSDDRFSYAFSSYAESWRPPLVYGFAGDRFVDRTRSFPGVVRSDRRRIRRYLPQVDDARGFVAASVADLYLLGRPAAARRYLDAAVRRYGGDPVWSGFEPALLKFLRKLGYR